MTNEKCKRATHRSGYAPAQVAVGHADGSSPVAGHVYGGDIGDA